MTSILSKSSGITTNNGTFNIASGTTLSFGTNSVFNQDGGTLNIDANGSFWLLGDTLNFNGGTIVGTPLLDDSDLNMGATATTAANFLFHGFSDLTDNLSAGQSVRVEGSSAGSQAQLTWGGTNPTNAGTVTLESKNSGYISNLVVSSGTLTNQAGGVINLNIGSGGGRSISGHVTNNGTINGAVVSSGNLIPGTSPGMITINGDYTQDAGGAMTIEINGTAPGTHHDQLRVLGSSRTVSLDGTLTASLGGGYVPATADLIAIIDNVATTTTVSGEFDGLPEGAWLNVGNQIFAITYQGGDGNDVVLEAAITVTTAVDEDDGTVNPAVGTGTSLREAINFANSNVGRDLIAFHIPGPGPHTINITGSVLPFITDPVIINGFTQTGSSPNTNAITQGSNAVHQVIVDGRGITSGAPARLVISAGNSEIRGLAFQNSVNNGILFTTSGGNLFAANTVTGVTGFAVQSYTANNTIGGSTPADRNVISGNGVGVHLFTAATTNNIVRGNFIGTAADGVTPLGNSQVGVRIDDGSNNIIGGPNVEDRNIVANSGSNGISSSNGDGNLIDGNYISVNILGNAAGNGGAGIALGTGAQNNQVRRNVIANSVWSGVYVMNTGNLISENSIHSNIGLGIDLNFDGVVNPNDLGDGDSGGNNLQNFPVLTSLNSVAGSTTVTGTLNSVSNANFTIEFFSNAAADPSGFGEGETFLGSTAVLTDGSGNANFGDVASGDLRYASRHGDLHPPDNR